MEITQQVFNGDFDCKKNAFIKFVDINRSQHAHGLLNILRFYENKFIITPENKDVLGNMLDYFTGNELSKYDLSKGIALIGGVGTGKTLIFKAIKDYTRDIIRNNSFIIKDVKSIIDGVNINGIEYLNEVNFIINHATTLYIDDIASGNEFVNHYGTKINAIEHLLSLRYDIYKKYNKLTHFTSNKYPAELKEIYGERIYDRMAEMFNVVELNCKSFR